MNRKQLLFTLAAAAFMVNVDAGVVVPLIAVMAFDLGADVLSAGLIVSAYTLPYGFLQIVYGPLADRWGRWRLIAAALLLLGLGSLLAAAAWDLGSLTAMRFLTGAVAAAVIPGAIALIGDEVPYDERQPVIGYVMGAIALAEVLSAGIGGLIGQVLGWRWVFGLAGAATLALGWQALRSVRQDAPLPVAGGLAGSFARIAALARRPGVATLCAIVFIEGALALGAFTYLGGFLDAQYTLPVGLIGLILGVFSIGSLAATRLLGPLVKRLGEPVLAASGALMMGAGFLTAALAPDWLFFPIGMFLAGFGFILCHTTLQTRATELAPEARGAAISLFAFVLFSGVGAGTALMAWLLAGGYGQAYTIVGMLLLGFAPVVALAIRHARPEAWGARIAG